MLYRVTAEQIKYMDDSQKAIVKKKGDVVEFKNPRLPGYFEGKIEPVVLERKEVQESQIGKELYEQMERMKFAQAEKDESVASVFAEIYEKMEVEELVKVSKATHVVAASYLGLKLSNTMKEATMVDKIKAEILKPEE